MPTLHCQIILKDSVPFAKKRQEQYFQKKGKGGGCCGPLYHTKSGIITFNNGNLKQLHVEKY